MIILGLNAYHGDSSACMIQDGELIAAVEEERFRRQKHWAGLPVRSVEYCLDAAGITLADIDHIAINRNPKANVLKKGPFYLCLALISFQPKNFFFRFCFACLVRKLGDIPTFIMHTHVLNMNCKAPH